MELNKHVFFTNMFITHEILKIFNMNLKRKFVNETEKI